MNRNVQVLMAASLLAFSAAAAEWSYTAGAEVELPEVTEATTLTISTGVTVTNTTA